MTALRHYRMPVAWWRAEWLRDLSRGAMMAYEQFHSYCATYGKRGLCPVISRSDLAREIDAPIEEVDEMLDAAIASGIVGEDESFWTLLEWELTQVPRSAPRTREYRERLRDAGIVTVTPKKERDATVTQDRHAVTQNRHAGDAAVTRKRELARLRSQKYRRNLKAKQVQSGADREQRDAVTVTNIQRDAGDATVTQLGSNSSVTVPTLRNVNVIDQRSNERNVTFSDQSVTIERDAGVTPICDAETLQKWCDAVALAVARIPKFEARPKLEDRTVAEEESLRIGQAVLRVATLATALDQLNRWEAENVSGALSNRKLPASAALWAWFKREIPRWEKELQPSLGALPEIQAGGAPRKMVESVDEGTITYRDVVSPPARRFGTKFANASVLVSEVLKAVNDG